MSGSEIHGHIAWELNQLQIHRGAFLISFEEDGQIIIAQVVPRHILQQGIRIHRSLRGIKILAVHRLRQSIAGESPVLCQQGAELINREIRRENVIKIVIEIKGYLFRMFRIRSEL